MELITENLVILDLDCTTKEEVIKLMAKKVVEEGIAESYEEYLDSLYKREEIAPTSVGYDVGLPHGKSKTVKRPAIAFVRLKTPVIWNLEDNENAKMVFMLAIPDEGKGSSSINVLIDLSKKILNDSFREKINLTNDISEVVKMINE